MSLLPPLDRPLSVSQLNAQIRQLLDNLPLLWVEGELSNFSRPSSGHWYFTLKDANAQVRAAMFKNRNMATRFAVKEGDKVLVRAKVSLYEGRGDYQLIVEHMEPAGLGDLQRQFEALKAQLQQEGLFDDDHKQEIPYLPARIGLVTSPSGAALRDLLQILGRRMPYSDILVLPVMVQGTGAAAQIAAAIAEANRANLCDLLIVGRGGGSLEDLWAFNEAVVARAIFASRIPIISAVGHETDITISDFVADARAPTPSAAAEMAVPDWGELAAYVAQQEQQLLRALQQSLRAYRQQLAHLKHRVVHPGRLVQMRQQQVDLLLMRLRRAQSLQVEAARQRLQRLQLRLQEQHPGAQLQALQKRWALLQQRFHYAAEQGLRVRQQRLAQAVQLLQSLSPLPTLERGYSLALSPSGDLLRRLADIPAKESFQLRFCDGITWVRRTQE
jgi:exodeoxyribonuclease VII large subunit